MLGAVSQASAAVEVKKNSAGEWQFLVDGQPFFVKGVTYGGGAPQPEMDEDFKLLKDLGVNAIRIWGCNDEATPRLLDTAQKNGIKVMLGLWIRHGRPGAEGVDHFNYVTDEAGKKAQFDEQTGYVKKFKDHPAVLCWGVGNEVTLNIATEEEKVAYGKFLETVCTEIKKLDPNHPIAAVSAWSTDWPYWQKYAPSVEIYGANVYGYSSAAIPGEIKKLGLDKPYLICEWGARGEWEMKEDANGVKGEPGDDEKYDTIAKGWKTTIEANKNFCLGAFVFHFGGKEKLDHTGLWLAFFAQKAYRPSYWATRFAFTGQEPPNHMPVIKEFLVAKQFEPKGAGSWIKVMVEAEDADKDPITLRFAYNFRKGPDNVRGEVLPLESKPVEGKPNVYEVKLPDLDGGIKLYALAEDTYPNLYASTLSLKIVKKIEAPAKP
jgi:hypothetical protein